MTDMPISAALQLVLRRLDALEGRLCPTPVPTEGDLLSSELHLRQLRMAAFPSDYFPDILWSLLLDLYLASFGPEGRTERELEQRLRLNSVQMEPAILRLINDGFAEFHRRDGVSLTRLRLSRLGVTTMQSVFARTQGRIAELRSAA